MKVHESIESFTGNLKYLLSRSLVGFGDYDDIRLL